MCEPASTDDEDECDCTKTNVLLYIFNFIGLLIGLALMVLGIVALVKPEFIFIVLGTIQGLSEIPVTFNLGGIFTASAVAMILIGLLVAAIGTFGAFGIFTSHVMKKILLIAYIVALVLVLVVELFAILFVIIAPEKVKEISQDVMKKTLSDFKEDLQFCTEGRRHVTRTEEVNSCHSSQGVRYQDGKMILPTQAVSLGWTVLQLEANCCGAYNYTDYSEWHRNVTINGVIHSAAVPISCCKKNKSLSLVSTPSFNTSIFTYLDGCLDGDYAYMNQKNCIDSIFRNIYKNQKKYIGIGATVIVQEVLLLIMFSVMYYHSEKARKRRKEEEDKKKKDIETKS